MQKPCLHKEKLLITHEDLDGNISKEFLSCTICGAEFKTQTEVCKMGYDPTNAIQGEDKTMLPKDSILDGVITQIDDGVVKDFVKSLDKWQGDTNGKAINVTMEVEGREEKVEFSQVFTYLEEDGKTVYTPKSNLGKYAKKYGGLPVVGQKLKVVTNDEGFGKVKLD